MIGEFRILSSISLASSSDGGSSVSLVVSGVDLPDSMVGGPWLYWSMSGLGLPRNGVLNLSPP